MSSFFLLPRPFSFFFNDPPSPEIYTLSLHDALPISLHRAGAFRAQGAVRMFRVVRRVVPVVPGTLKARSEEHTSELQSRGHLVCRLLLEKKKNTKQHKLISGTDDETVVECL